MVRRLRDWRRCSSSVSPVLPCSPALFLLWRSDCALPTNLEHGDDAATIWRCSCGCCGKNCFGWRTATSCYSHSGRLDLPASHKTPPAARLAQRQWLPRHAALRCAAPPAARGSRAREAAPPTFGSSESQDGRQPVTQFECHPHNGLLPLQRILKRIAARRKHPGLALDAGDEPTPTTYSKPAARPAWRQPQLVHHCRGRGPWYVRGR